MSNKEDLYLFPVSAKITPAGHLSISNLDLEELADQYGTPLYIYDAATIRNQIDSLQCCLKTWYPGPASIAYAVKAYFSYAFARHIAPLGLGADVVSMGEILIANKAGLPRDGIHLHGNNKTEEELTAALEWGIQAIVVDSLDELQFLDQLAAKLKKKARIWLRITPDLRVNTHPHIETSASDSKFGLHIQNGQAAQAIRYAQQSNWLNLVGLHTHLGSQLFDPIPYQRAVEMLYELAEHEHYIPEEISPGGGWGVPYIPRDQENDCEAWVKTVSEAIQKHCTRLNWPLPRLILEPGRWIVARAGMAIYRVGSQKITVNENHIVSVDGGMADNPRTALYQAEYTARIVQRANAEPVNQVRIVGKFCESGDVLIPEVHLPEVQRGDLLAVPVAGAYQLSMSSNYNLATRPAVLWLDDGQVEVMQPRERPELSGWWTGTPES